MTHGKPGRKPGMEEVLIKERAVLQLRREGKLWDEIAREVGYASASGAQRAHVRALDRIVYDDVKATRLQEQDRLDMLMQANWAAAMRGHIDSGVFVLRVMERRAKLLGLDMPTRIETTLTVWDGTGEFDAELREILSQLEQLDVDVRGVEGAPAEDDGVSAVLGAQQG